MAIGNYEGIETGGAFSDPLAIGETPSFSEVFTAGWWGTTVGATGSFEARPARFFGTDTSPEYEEAIVIIESDWDALIVGNTFKTLE